MNPFTKQIAQLNMRNHNYRLFVMDVLGLFLKQDLGAGDKTTQLLKNPAQKIQAEVIAKEMGVLSGMEEVEFFLRKKDVRVLRREKDGSVCVKNKVVLKIEASAQKILTLERTILNLLQRMSGIATSANKLAQKIGFQKFSATRKTPLGLLDTKAVITGGGLPHRLSLADMILMKENHIKADADCWKKIPLNSQNFFEIEANNVKLAIEITKHFAKSKKLILLLDNFTTRQLSKLIPQLHQINPRVILEASGGITTKNAKQFLKSGVDFISLGALTHSVKALDFSLRVI